MIVHDSLYVWICDRVYAFVHVYVYGECGRRKGKNECSDITTPFS